ncbi:NACHT domain-containing protein 1 [Elsinoe fawcettii]|nr:NACHT domain-containing protein 1 [Elsinoe fawcettii]
MASLNTHEPVFDQILRDFKSKLPVEDVQYFKGTNINDVRRTIASLQDQHVSSRRIQNLPRLRRFIEATESYTKVLDLFANVDDIVAFVWGPIKWLLLTTHVVTEAFNSLLQTYEKIGNEMPLLGKYQELFGDDNDIREVLAATFRVIFDFHLKAVKYFKSRLWRQIFKAHIFRTDFQDLIEDMRSQARLVEKHGDLIAFRKDLEERSEARRRHEHLLKDERLRRRLYLLDWIKAPNMHLEQERLQLVRRDRPASGRWLLSRTSYQQWYDLTSNAASSLWINGIPGAGKTVLASLVVDECRKHSTTNTLYFYCSHSDTSRNTFLSLARALISQSMQFATGFMVDDLLHHAISTRDEKPPFSTRQATEKLLENCLSLAGSLYIIIDGLDECSQDEQKYIAQWMRKYVESTAALTEPTRCVFFSQDDACTRQQMSGLPTVQITLQDLRQDILLYCQDQSKELGRKFTVGGQDTAYVAQAVVHGARGMFLYARLFMDHLLGQYSYSDVINEINQRNLPRELSDVYRRILDRIMSNNQFANNSWVKLLLAWLVCARRAMKWHEIQCAVSIDPDAGTVNTWKRFATDAKSICGSLIDVKSDSTVELVHGTTRRYLLDSKHVNEIKGHLNVARVCLDQFSMEAYGRTIEDDQLTQYVRTGTFAFAEYALTSWVHHMVAAFTRPQSSPDVSLDTDEFAQILDVYLDVYWITPTRTAKATTPIVTAVQNMVKVKKSTELQMTMAALSQLTSSELEHASAYETITAFTTHRRARLSLEVLAQNGDDIGNLHDLYGELLFKCDRLYCPYFHHGFATATQRDTHKAQHDRHFLCRHIGCAYSILGFPTRQELDSHNTAVHTDDLPADDEFPPEKTAESRDHVQRLSPLQCSICREAFPNKILLRVHRQTHTDPRPFVCSSCGQSFSRRQELDRHEFLHKNEKPFVCRGSDPGGTSWGCGRRFVRMGGLKSHIVSGRKGAYKDKKSNQCNIQESVSEETTTAELKRQKIDFRRALASLSADTNSQVAPGDTGLSDMEEYMDGHL